MRRVPVGALLALLVPACGAAASPQLVLHAETFDRRVAPQTSVEFPFNLTNAGDVALDVSFSIPADAGEEGWNPIAPMPVGLQPGETRAVGFQARAPAAFGYVSKARAFTLEVTGVPEAEGLEPVRTSVSFLARVEGFYVAAPGWAAVAALVLVAATARRG